MFRRSVEWIRFSVHQKQQMTGWVRAEANSITRRMAGYILWHASPEVHRKTKKLGSKGCVNSSTR